MRNIRRIDALALPVASAWEDGRTIAHQLAVFWEMKAEGFHLRLPVLWRR